MPNTLSRWQVGGECGNCDPCVVGSWINGTTDNRNWDVESGEFVATESGGIPGPFELSPGFDGTFKIEYPTENRLRLKFEFKLKSLNDSVSFWFGDVELRFEFLQYSGSNRGICGRMYNSGVLTHSGGPDGFTVFGPVGTIIYTGATLTAPPLMTVYVDYNGTVVVASSSTVYTYGTCVASVPTAVRVTAGPANTSGVVLYKLLMLRCSEDCSEPSYCVNGYHTPPCDCMEAAPYMQVDISGFTGDLAGLNSTTIQATRGNPCYTPSPYAETTVPLTWEYTTPTVEFQNLDGTQWTWWIKKYACGVLVSQTSQSLFNSGSTLTLSDVESYIESLIAQYPTTATVIFHWYWWWTTSSPWGFAMYLGFKSAEGSQYLSYSGLARYDLTLVSPPPSGDCSSRVLEYTLNRTYTCDHYAGFICNDSFDYPAPQTPQNQNPKITLTYVSSP